jgi:hypothetical protein
MFLPGYYFSMVGNTAETWWKLAAENLIGWEDMFGLV